MEARGVPNAVYHFCFTRHLTADDARMPPRAEISIRRPGLEQTGRLAAEREAREPLPR